MSGLLRSCILRRILLPIGPIPEEAANQPITKEDIRRLIHEWGRLHDDHAPLSAFVQIIAIDVTASADQAEAKSVVQWEASI